MADELKSKSPTPVHDESTPIEPDDDHGDEAQDTSEADGESRGSTSISSSVRDYAFENNRRYHRFQEGRYHFPNDEPEQEREDMKHAMVVSLSGGRLHYAPLEDPQEILDVGTGTGIWAIDSTSSFVSRPHLQCFALQTAENKPQIETDVEPPGTGTIQMHVNMKMLIGVDLS
jgi:hypothetical protein